MKVKVTYCVDPQGMGKDVTEVIDLPKDIILWSHYPQENNDVRSIVQKELYEQGKITIDSPQIILIKSV